jgi:energy-coupling factor transporter ATPase
MSEVFVSIEGLQHTYLPGTPLAAVALRGASLELRRGEIAALIGVSGAGKSTLVHFLNGLLRPTQLGQARILGQDTASRTCDLGALRRRVGLVFQYPHRQLFERYVGDDVAYGARELGLARDEVRERVRWALRVVGLDWETFVDRQTFALSGGEMRRVALAGVLAMRPDLLVLDEATTGLDPRGRREIHALLRLLRNKEGMSVLIVSNDMDEVAELAERVTVLHEGQSVLSGSALEVFAQRERLQSYGLATPAASDIIHALRQAGLAHLPDAITVSQTEEVLWQAMTP